MAIASSIVCKSCGNRKTAYHPSSSLPPRTCPECEIKQAADVKAQALAEIAAKPLEERLAAIEEWIYDHKQVRHGYTPEPRF